MKILLFNDNPVVRKLVALSAQKTKDDLSVVWSADEVEGSEYDLLIVDDALYSDDLFESLDQKIRVKSKLLMATRGNGVPEGFDNVLNKPFLPTDLVDMLVKIEKSAVGSSNAKAANGEESPMAAPLYSINLEDTLPEIERPEGRSLDLEDLDGDDNDFDFGNLEDFEDKLPETGILDHEEVQEVQGLLEDTEEEPMEMEEDILVQGIDELEMPKEEEDDLLGDLGDDFSFDEVPAADKIEEEMPSFDDVLDDEMLKLDEESADKELLDEEEFGDLELPSSLDELSGIVEEEPKAEEPIGFDEEADFDEEISLDEADDLDESALEDMDMSGLMDDGNYLEQLEAKINSAVNGLEPEELDRELSSDDLDESLMADFDLDLHESSEEPKGEMSGLDELDMLDEMELKRAIGEEVDEEEELEAFSADEDGGFSDDEIEDDLVDEEFPDAMIEKEPEVESSATPTEGVEALQALLKALSNEDVAKSLKGMNISININFGNGA
ncbi:hypothetical protein [Sulfuricurvum sp.]|uniref:hypothetical protein n=1 Tax=Sulfuricurvum sp. TaxID=2025608 RepID=UPI002E312812|nr:hypothetical protein [Sulfuricurvum sp.]HEX5330485.1 hypothetical protein [Sulfuricurvum sp.]